MVAKELVEWIPPGATALCVYFIHAFIADFKTFKRDCKKELKDLERIKEEANNAIYLFTENMRERISELKEVHRDTKLSVDKTLIDLKNDVERFAVTITTIEDKAKNAELYFTKGLALARAIDAKVKIHSMDIHTIKVHLKENLTIFKTKKP